MISDIGRKLFATPLSRLVPWVQATGITPNGLTILGFVLTAIAAYLLATGRFFSGGIVLLVGAFFDMMDGHLARATNQASVFGAFLDSVLDRYSESVILIALTYYYAHAGRGLEVVLLAATMVGSLMVSYTRARAEALNIECKVGILQRPERVILLVVALITGWVTPVLWMLGILTNVTAVQRIVEVYQRTHQSDSSTRNVVATDE
ncbi:MAG: CDP-alcohol phosphatidyltransferase family protein [Caldilineaceae bacterium]|nr:CDP-alcohol phosphatidyltransferase family protein [Caldilineaceae bacterium]